MSYFRGTARQVELKAGDGTIIGHFIDAYCANDPSRTRLGPRDIGPVNSRCCTDELICARTNTEAASSGY